MTRSRTLLPVLLATVATTALAQGPNRCASADAAGNAGNSGSYRPHFSADGRFVAFQSSASNLVLNDTNGEMDIFVKDRATGTIERVSVSSAGVQANGHSSDPAMSADGRYVVFTSRANNFTVFDQNGAPDVYRHDRVTGQTVLVSCSVLGLVGNDGSGSASIAADGRHVAFRSLASNLVPGDGNGVTDIFVKDLANAVVELISSAGPNVPGNLSAGQCVISRDGRFVAFDSYASNLVANDSNGTADVFVRDRQTWALHRISVGPNNTQASGPSDVLDISADGSVVLFQSWANNLVAGDTSGVDIFVGDPIGAAVARVSLGDAGQQANDNCMTAAMSGDGRFVAFGSRASNLVAGDYNQALDVFLRDRTASTTVRASLDLGGSSPNGDCVMPAVDDSGRLVAFSTYAMRTLAIPMNSADQIVVADLQPAVQATFATFGSGCRGASGVPALDRATHTLPWTGTTLQLEGDTMLGNSFGILCLGFSDTVWNGTPLPAPLAGFGMGSCTLYTSVDLTAGFSTTSQGTFTFGLGIPAGPGWLGARLFAQGWVLDPWANALGAAVTNAVAFTIGG